MATPLPPLGDLFGANEAAPTACQRITPLEAQKPLFIRILGWMLIHAPLEAGRAYVARSINSCETDQEIFELGDHHLKYFIKYFKAQATKPTPTPSTHPSRPSIEALRQNIFDSRVEAPKSHSMAKDQALVRDNYRCMLSGVVDFQSFNKNPSLQAEHGAASTECCHILPQYITHGITNDHDKAFAYSNIWSIVRRFGGVPEEELNGAGIHNLRNVMTLEAGIHGDFDHLLIWLEWIEGNRYGIGKRNPVIRPYLPAEVTFTTSNAASHLPLPDRRYLALHAACAKVIHMSGAAEFIDSILHDMEYTKVLSEDGSSGQLLDYLFSGESLMVS